MSLIYKIEKKAINGFLWSGTSRLEVQSTAKAISTSISVGVTSISVRLVGVMNEQIFLVFKKLHQVPSKKMPFSSIFWGQQTQSRNI